MMRSYVVFINFGHFKSTIILSRKYKEAKVRRGMNGKIFYCKCLFNLNTFRIEN